MNNILVNFVFSFEPSFHVDFFALDLLLFLLLLPLSVESAYLQIKRDGIDKMLTAQSELVFSSWKRKWSF